MFSAQHLKNVTEPFQIKSNQIFLGPKYDSNQPSYPGFERDVFKTVSDYFYSLPQPLLTFEYYELFVNILGMYAFCKL
jgi:hypothetical protein